MADLKPIGSEKLQGQDKINRILEIARYKENTPSSLNETSNHLQLLLSLIQPITLMFIQKCLHLVRLLFSTLHLFSV